MRGVMRPIAYARGCSGMSLRPVAALVAALAAVGCAATGLPDQPVVKDYEPTQWVAPLKSGLRVDRPGGSQRAPRHGGVRLRGGQHQRSQGGRGAGPLRRAPGLPVQAGRRRPAILGLPQADGRKLQRLHQLGLHQLLHHRPQGQPRDDVAARGLAAGPHHRRASPARCSPPSARWCATSCGSAGRPRSATGMFDLVLRGAVSGGPPPARSGLGTHESLSAITLDHAQAFVKEHYRPDNCTIVIAGDVDTEKVKQLLGQWPAEILFGPGGQSGPAVPPRARVAERKAPEVPTPPVKEMQRHKGPIEQPELMLAWSLPPGLPGQGRPHALRRRTPQPGPGRARRARGRRHRGRRARSPSPWPTSSVMMLSASLKPGGRSRQGPPAAAGRAGQRLVHQPRPAS